jgi:hypothetical protein
MTLVASMTRAFVGWCVRIDTSEGLSDQPITAIVKRKSILAKGLTAKIHPGR